MLLIGVGSWAPSFPGAVAGPALGSPLVFPAGLASPAVFDVLLPQLQSCASATSGCRGACSRDLNDRKRRRPTCQATHARGQALARVALIGHVAVVHSCQLVRMPGRPSRRFLMSSAGRGREHQASGLRVADAGSDAGLAVARSDFCSRCRSSLRP